jgi:hypothetical protein
MKFSFAYVKANPIMFGAIVIVFGLLFWVLINRGSGAGQTIVTGSAGPSDASIAAATQVQLASIAAGSQGQMAQLAAAAQADVNQSQFAIAGMELQYQLAQLGADREMSHESIQASLLALNAQLDNSLQVTNSNNAFALDYARTAADSATTQLMIGAALQRDLGAQQMEAFKFSSEIGALSSLKKKDRDNALAGIVGYAIPNDPKRSGGGGGLLSLLKGVAAPLPALVSRI